MTDQRWLSWWKYAVVAVAYVAGGIALLLTFAWPLATACWLLAILNAQWAWEERRR